MISDWVIILLALVVAAATQLAWTLTAQNRLAVRRRVMVNLTSGQAVSGVLWARRGRHLVLKDATLHERGVEPTTVDGEVLVERHRVDFMQVL